MLESLFAPSKSMNLPRRVFTALLLSTAISAAGIGYAVSEALPNTAPLSVTPVDPQAGFAPLVARVKPAVVQIATTSRLGGDQQQGTQQFQNMPDIPAPFGDMFRRYFNQPGNILREQRALGSGFIIDPAGYIVTNNHVVDGAHQVSVTLSDGSTYKAKVIGRDSKTDLALLKVDAGHNLPYVAFGNSDSAHEGDWVVAVGNPYGLGGTVTAGIISAHGRNINDGPYDDFLQIDAPINPGNSGGPLFNQSGQVVGIDTAIYSPSGGSIGIGFAIPSNVAKNIVAQLRDHGKVTRGWLGISMQPLTQPLAKAVGLKNDQGVLVDTVTDGSPAAAADLRQGDVILAFDGKPIAVARDLAMAVAETPAGHTVPVKLWRENHTLTLNVTIRAERDAQVASASLENAMKPVGMSLQPLTADDRSRLNIPAGTAGVLVGQVTPGSNADESGVMPGDVIERIGSASMHSPDQVADAIHAAERDKSSAVSMLVLRNGATFYLGLQLA